jgi:hypothetical protein
LQDPQNPQRFGRAPDPVTRDRSIFTISPTSAGTTGFDSTGSITKRKKKPGPGTRHLGSTASPPVVSAPLYAAPRQAGAYTPAPRSAGRPGSIQGYTPQDAPVRQRRPLVPLQDPFEPTGVRVGDFLLRPSIELSRGLDTNPARVPNGRSSQFTLVAPELQLRTDWSRHEAGAVLRGSYTAYDTQSSLNRPSADAKVYGRIDATRDTRIDLEGRFLLDTDNPGSPNLSAGLAKLPVYTTLGASAGLVQRFNHLEFSAKALIDRTTYRDSKLTDGSTSSNHDRDFNQYAGQLRASYEVSPGLKPFVGLDADKRVHDVVFDRNGTQRDSRAITPRVGTTFEFTRQLTGEVSVGYITRRYQDPRLQELRGVVADASLVWAATGLTTATLTASSRAEESAVAGVSGALRRDAALQVDHAFRRWLIGTVKAGYGTDDYVGSVRQDTRTSLGAALAYKVNRELALKGEVRQEWMHSNVSGVDYAASIFMLGLKLQR